ncbi:MAG: metallophosphoesterase [Gammaproteobacteria bacterium]|nr:metallophosphoesterase [Gammaproteobacteria bacterium]MDH4256560.1 metallophosphoesterase [Gammaproteobacteria bacterium]MDH5312075.1 metallophosphoesterase [Gammaproteobacteria bacterium]
MKVASRAVRAAFFLLAVSFLPACGTGPVFQHDFESGNRPWSDARFDDAPGKFTFAVFGDLNGGERDRVFDIAVAQLAMLRPELIVGVGDLINGETDDPAMLHGEWDRFDERASRAKAPVFYVGGNHDLTGEPLQQVWDERYGRRYYHFVYKNVLFLVLDTEDNTPERARHIFEARNHALRVFEEQGEEAFGRTEYANLPELPAGNITDAQSRYFVDAIAANPGVRWTFLFMHKSPWLREDLDAFTAIEDALAGSPYTVFSGHNHVYSHTERRGRDYIHLGTTGGSQGTGPGRSMDHVTLVTVADDGVDVANLLLEGILDKTGHVPLGGEDVCFEAARCADAH